MLTEEELFGSLVSALRPPADLPREPSLAELARLRAALEGPRRRPRPRYLPAWGLRQRAAAMGMAGLVAVGAAAAATATGTLEMPRAVRAVAHQVGLPVESPEVDDVHDALDRLKDAQKSGDSKKVAREEKNVRSELADVPSDERSALQPEVSTALAANPTTVTQQSPESPPPDVHVDQLLPGAGQDEPDSPRRPSQTSSQPSQSASQPQGSDPAQTFGNESESPADDTGVDPSATDPGAGTNGTDGRYGTPGEDGSDAGEGQDGAGAPGADG